MSARSDPNEVIDRGLRAWMRGDLEALAALLDSGVTLRAATPGLWDCSGREQVMRLLRERQATRDRAQPRTAEVRQIDEHTFVVSSAGNPGHRNVDHRRRWEGRYDAAVRHERAAVTGAVQTSAAGEERCWCCGQAHPDSEMIHLGEHPEAVVCLRCAHFLHQQARGREDATRPSVAARGRDVLRAGRRAVMRRGWHRQPVIGPVLRWLGPRLP